MVFPKMRTKYLLIGLAAILLTVLLVWGGILAYHVVTLNQNAHQLLDTIQADKIDISAVKPDLQAVVSDLDSIKSDLNPLFPLFNTSSALPAIGPLLSQVEPLLNFSQGLAQVGSILFDAFEPVLNSSAQPGSTTTERLFKAIQSNQDAINQVQQIIDQIAPERQKIQAALLPDSIQKYYARLDPLFPILQKGLPALKQVPVLMGANGAMNYLILAQNRDEMRATGGFISGIGLASFDQGKLASFSIGDSYAVDNYKAGYPTPPAPRKQFMLADYWVPRDANWSPDYPTAAQQAQALYTLSTKVQTQGVISFDQLAVKGVLQALGPVTISDYPDPISASNVEEFMIQSWSPDPATGVTNSWWSKRKQFMGELGKVILAKFFALSDQKALANLAVIAVDLIKSGHLLIYVNQPEMSAVLASAHLDGSISPSNADFLYLVDSNIGFNKVDTVINRQLLYEVDLSNPQTPQAQITASYQHTIQKDVVCKNEANYGTGTYADLQTRCYWDYWRIYMPSGSQLVSSAVQPVPASELLYGKDWPAQVLVEKGENDTQVFAGLMVLPTHSQQQNKITVSLPASVLQKNGDQGWLYNLLIQKQPGLTNLPVTVKIKLPDNAAISPGFSDWKTEGDNTWSWNGTLTGTRQLSLAFTISH
jgi:hypothetical protein